MGSLFEVPFAAFILISTFYLITASDDMKDDGLDREASNDRDGLWFGPRLGKRSLQLNDEDKSDTFLKLLEAADNLKLYYDQMPEQMQADAPQKVSKKVIITPKLGKEGNRYVGKKYNNYEFTPRLGRKLPDRLTATTQEEDIVVSYPVVMYPSSPYYTPRLGRNYKFSPRLGRELYDLYPETQIRVARSINSTKSD